MAVLKQVALILLAIDLAYGLTCYKCDSSQSALCSYGFTSLVYNTVDCQAEAGGTILTNWLPKQCVKIVATDTDGKEYIARGCMPHLGGACDAVIKTLGFFSDLGASNHNLACYPCEGDKCNAAVKLGGVTIGTLLLSAILFLI